MPNTQVLFTVAGTEWLWILIIIVILLFGARKIPELARSMGRAKGEFEKGKQDVPTEMKQGEKYGKSDEEERRKLEAAAKALGIDVEGKSVEELREAIKKAT